MEELNAETIELAEKNANVGETLNTAQRKLFGNVSSVLKAAWKKKAVRITVCCAVACVIILVGWFIWKSSFSLEAVASKAAVAYIEDDMEKFGEYLAMDTTDYLKQFMQYEDMEEEEFFEQVSDLFDGEIESWGELIDIVHEEQQYSLEDSFGPYTLSATVRNVREYSARKILSITDKDLVDLCDDLDSISKGCVATVKVTVDGEDDSDRVTVTLNMVKIDGEWKIIEVNRKD